MREEKKDQKDYGTGSPRLYVGSALKEDTTLPLDDKAAHYLKNVLRRPEGSELRIFNGRNGEYLATLRYDRKNAALEIKNRIREQTDNALEIHLTFTPIKKDRLDFLIEKAVELGVTHLHPVLTRQTSIRDMNEERIVKQITEACEQCERLSIPVLGKLQSLDSFLRVWPETIPLYAALEREAAAHLESVPLTQKAGLLVGPEGGFSPEEKALLLAHDKITPVSLGDHILRAETAALLGVGLLSSKQYT